MRKVVKRTKLVNRLLDNAANVVSVLHACVYFPTYSNGLKAVGGHLGCTWTEESYDDRPRVNQSVWQCLDAMKKAGKVARTPDRAYFITVRGLAWLERY